MTPLHKNGQLTLGRVPTSLFTVRGRGRNRFVRVQNGPRVEHLFHVAHESKGRSSPTVVDVVALAESDAMLGTDAAAALRHVLVEERLDETHNLATVHRTRCIEVKVA